MSEEQNMQVMNDPLTPFNPQLFSDSASPAPQLHGTRFHLTNRYQITLRRASRRRA